jgi:hypothetical protein
MRDHTPPFRILFGREPDYAMLRVFGCLCYPNTTSTRITGMYTSILVPSYVKMNQLYIKIKFDTFE